MLLLRSLKLQFEDNRCVGKAVPTVHVIEIAQGAVNFYLSHFFYSVLPPLPSMGCERRVARGVQE